MEDVYSNSRVLPLRGDINFRDFGGYHSSDGCRIKQGVIYRSGTLSALSDADLAAISRLDLKRIIDLRSDWEIKREGFDRLYPGNENRYDFLPFDYGDPYLSELQMATEAAWDIHRVDFENLYVNMLEQNGKSLKIVFDRFADPSQYPLLIHCTQGKDRTGIVAALLLLLLGVPHEAVMEDYMLTGKLIDWQQKHREMMEYFEDSGDDWAPFFTCLPQAMENLFVHVENHYAGAVVHFLNSIGVAHDQQKRIREFLLEN